MCAAVVCVVFYVLTRSFELKSKLLWTFNKNIRRELQVGDFNISPLPMKWYKNWKDMWHFTAKKMTNIESNEKLVIKKKNHTTKQMWDVELNSPILPLWSYHWSTSIIHEIFLGHFHSFNSTRVFFKISFECFSKIRMLC